MSRVHRGLLALLVACTSIEAFGLEAGGGRNDEALVVSVDYVAVS